MCPPAAAAALPALTIGTSGLATAQLGLAGLSAVAGIAGSVIQSNRQNQAAADTAAASLESFRFQTERLGVQQMQEDNQVGQQIEDAMKKRIRSTGAALTSAAAGNVQGVSVDRLMTDYLRSESVFKDRAMQGADQSRDQRQADARGIGAQETDRSRSAPTADGTEVFGSVVRGVGGLFNTYAGVRKDLIDTGAPSSGATRNT